MSLLYKRRALIAAVGTGTYPADPTPDADDIILTYGLVFTPFEGNKEKLDPDRDFVGNGVEYHTGPHAKVSFEVDLVGSGAAGVAPVIGRLLRMCGMSETIVADTSVTYGLTSDLVASEWGSLYVILHGSEQHKLTGVRGTCTFRLSKEGMPKIAFEFTGLWDQTPTTVSLGAVDYSVFEKPVPANATNTTKLTIDGYAACCEEAEFVLGHQVEYRNLMGCEGVYLTDRSATASFSIEKPSIATKDFFALVRTHAEVSGTITHGLTAGRIVTFPFRGQLMMGSETDSQGFAVLPLTANLIPSTAGNDEFSVVLT